jgi:hypothetical protein
MATAKKSSSVKKVAPIASAAINEATDKVHDINLTVDELKNDVESLKAELAALKARLFHPSEN